MLFYIQNLILILPFPSINQLWLARNFQYITDL